MVGVVGKEYLGLGYVVGRCLDVVGSKVVVEVERVLRLISVWLLGLIVGLCLLVGVGGLGWCGLWWLVVFPGKVRMLTPSWIVGWGMWVIDPILVSWLALESVHLFHCETSDGWARIRIVALYATIVTDKWRLQCLSLLLRF